MVRSGTDYNLLLGFLAVQLDFVSRDALIAAMSTWVLDKSKSVGQILVAQSSLDQDALSLIEALVDRHLKLHDNDPQKSLSAVASQCPNSRDLASIGDAEVQASLSSVRGDGESSVPETRVCSVGMATSSGMRFRVIRAHAKGAIGEVSVAVDDELQREVALKELQEQFADDPNSRARFVQEAEITGRLEHPGIVPVYGFGWHADGRPYYAMRLIKGETLRETIRRFHLGEGFGEDPGERLLARNQLLRRFISVCEAVQYAHSRGIVHRDIKPGNIMLGPYGETLLVDWGLAKRMADREVLAPPSTSQADLPVNPGPAGTGQGRFIGTPGYASPEQAAGNQGEVGPSSDIYSLGATFYTVLTNRSPFDEEDIPVMLNKVGRGQFPAPTQINGRVPKGLEAICLKAMNLRPQDRYGSARDLGEDIERFLSNESVLALKSQSVASSARPSLRISIHTDGQAVFRSGPLEGAVEIGRPLERDEPTLIVSSQDGYHRLAIPDLGGSLDRCRISRRHARLEARPHDKVHIRNVSPSIPLHTRNQGRLEYDDEGTFRLPVELLFKSVSGKTRQSVFLEDGTGTTRGLVPDLPVTELDALDDDESQQMLSEQEFGRWVQGVVDLTRHRGDRDELFRETAQWLHGIFHLDLAAVFLFDGSTWEAQAVHAGQKDGTPVVNPSSYVLNKLVEKKTAIWQTPTTDTSEASIQDLRGFLAAPILGSAGNVIGALYGELDLTSLPTKFQVRLECMFLGLVAALIASRMQKTGGGG